MNPPIGLVTPVKAAIGQWLLEFFAQFHADTPQSVEWAARAPEKAMVWAPARMVDSVEEMLTTWRRNDNSGKAGTSDFTPVLFLAVASDYTETPGEGGRPLTDYVPFAFPGDALKRSYRVRVISADLRAQVVVVSPNAPTSMSMIGQLMHWAAERQRFRSTYTFAGFPSQWPVKVEQADRMAIPTPLGEQLCVLSVDLTLRATMPMFYAPKAGQPNDGQAEPAGYPTVQQVTNAHNMGLGGVPTGVTAEEWAAYVALAGGRGGPDSNVVLLPINDNTVSP